MSEKAWNPYDPNETRAAPWIESARATYGVEAANQIIEAFHRLTFGNGMTDPTVERLPDGRFRYTWTSEPTGGKRHE